MYDFKVVQTDYNSINEIVSLLNEVFPNLKSLNAEYIKWQYELNPIGKVVGYNAYMGKQLVSHYVTLPIVAKLFNNEVKGLLSLNTATHKQHQGKKLFTTLAHMTYSYGVDLGYNFVIGVANANSTHGFEKKLGFHNIGPLEAKIGIGQISIKNSCKELDFFRVWNEELLQWRLNNPIFQYKIVNNRIYAPINKYGIFAIMSLDKFKNQYFQSNCINIFNPFKLFIGIDNMIDWKKSLYFDVPKKFRPSPLNLIFKDLSNKNIIIDKKNIKFNLIDFDAY